jgi:hypothetical protein
MLHFSGGGQGFRKERAYTMKITDNGLMLKIIIFLLIIILFVFLFIFTGNDNPEASGGAPFISEPTKHTPSALQATPDATPNTAFLPSSAPVFPSLHITSPLHPFEAERTFWHRGSLSLVSETEGFSFDGVSVQLRGRGNTTWVAGDEKKPLRIRFAQPRALLGSEYAHRDWILLAHHFDITLMRNHAAFHLSNLLDGIDFYHNAFFVHLYINGEYAGVYELTDERDVGPGRLALSFDPDPAVSEYLFELDRHLVGWLRHYNEEGVDYFMVDHMPYGIRFPRQREWDGHLEYLQAFVENAGEVIRTRDYERIKTVIDIPSFIDFYLVQEVMKNADVGWFSIFMTVRGQGDGRRLFFGPVWDFDRSSGHMLYMPGPEGIYAGHYHAWFRDLLATPEIYALIVDRWNEIADSAIPQMLAHIRYMYDRYEREFLRNYERHHIIGTPRRPSHPQVWTLPDFRAHVAFLLLWLETRVAWLDDFYNGRPTTDSRMFEGICDDEAMAVWRFFERNRDPITISINDEVQPVAIPPMLLQGRLMIPLLEVAGLFGLVVELDDSNGMITLRNNGTAISHVIGSTVYHIDGAPVYSSASIRIADWVFIPLHIITDALGYGALWDVYTMEVSVKTR